VLPDHPRSVRAIATAHLRLTEIRSSTRTPDPGVAALLCLACVGYRTDNGAPPVIVLPPSGPKVSGANKSATAKRNGIESNMAPYVRDEEFDLRAILKVFRRRRGVFIGTVLVFTGAALALALNVTPQYTAVSTIVVEPRQVRVIDFDDVNQSQSILNDAEIVNTHAEVLTSTSFVEEVIVKANLLDNPEFNVALRGAEALDSKAEAPDSGDVPASSRAVALVSQAMSWARTHLSAIGLTDQPSPAPPPVYSNIRRRLFEPAEAEPSTGQSEPAVAPVAQEVVARFEEIVPTQGRGAPQVGWDAKSGLEGEAIRASDRSEKEQGPTAAAAEDGARDMLMTAATDLFLEQLKVGQSRRSYAISVSFTSTDPATAAQVANAMAELYIDHQLQSKVLATSGALDWLTRRLNELRKQVVEAEQAAESYREENQLLGSDRGLAFNDQELAAIAHELIVSGAERLASEVKLGQIRQLRSNSKSLDSVPEIMMSPVIATLRQEEIALLREEAQLRQEYGPRHPKIVQMEADKQNVRARLNIEIQQVIAALENEIATIEAREEALQAKLKEAKAAAAESNHAEIQLNLLEREAESARTLYATMLNRFKELTEQRELLEPGVRVISEATIPTEPSFPQVELMTGAGFMGSLMFAMLLAFVVDRVDGGLRTGRQTEELLHLPQIGLVPKLGGRIRRRGPHRYLVEKPTSPYAEAIRSVQTALYFSNVDRPPQVVLVTSSVTAEGKTTLALSLATLLAQSGFRTVAVDLDLRRPTLGRALRRSESGDLVAYMKGQKTIDDIAHQVDLEDNLHIVPARRLAANPADLLASQKMADLMVEMRARYDYVILDSPPLLGMSDSRFAAALADAVVFVVRWSKTGDEVAMRALEVLRQSAAPIAGAVLTQVNIRRHNKYSPEEVAHYYSGYKKYYVH
jgi:polysaccharide biosynthesis transport protein